MSNNELLLIIEPPENEATTFFIMDKTSFLNLISLLSADQSILSDQQETLQNIFNKYLETDTNEL